LIPDRTPAGHTTNLDRPPTNRPPGQAPRLRPDTDRRTRIRLVVNTIREQPTRRLRYQTPTTVRSRGRG
jgi:hypothetical protein